ncbi:MAG: EpsG family protein [Sarcina sp.]
MIYITNTLSILLLSAIDSLNKKTKKYNNLSNIFFWGSFIALTCISGFRNKVGTDFWTYKDIYVVFGADKAVVTEPEFGFQILMNLIHLITDNPQMFFFITSLIINFSICLFIKKYSVSPMMSIYFYITTFVFYGTMNGIRQYIASCIMLLGFKYIEERKILKYILVVLLASTFHISAFIFIPIYFIANQEINSKLNKIFIAIIGLGMIFYQQFLNGLFSIIGDSHYGHYKETFFTGTNGANVLRIIVWWIPLIILILKREKVKEVFGDKSKILINMCFYGACFMLLAYRHVYFARFCMYFDFYYLLALPFVYKIFEKKTSRFLCYSMIIGYFAYSFLLLLRGESNIYPYNFNLDLF